MLKKYEPYMTVGKLERAKRRAINIFEEWNEVTGIFEPETGYYYEAISVIEDAVECGAQSACGVYKTLHGE